MTTKKEKKEDGDYYRVISGKKMSRQTDGKKKLNPKMEAFVNFKNYVGEKIGNKGSIGASMAALYKNKVKGGEDMPVAKMYAQAKKLFDAESKATIQKMADKIKADQKKKRELKKKQKK